MLQRFLGEAGRRLRQQVLTRHKMVNGNEALAAALAEELEPIAIEKGQALIQQDGTDNDIYLIVVGSFGVFVEGDHLATRGVDDTVGEMAALEPSQLRSATVVAAEPSVVFQLSEVRLHAYGELHPQIYLYLARELAKRLRQRNKFVAPVRPKLKVFLISSAESIGVAQAIQSALSYDPFIVKIWSDGVFKLSHYALQSLEAQVEDADFAVAIAHGDDRTLWREKDWPTPRDNVIFEFGLFMGRLGRERAILMEPRDAGVKLPSDLAGVHTVPYRYEPGEDLMALMGPACNALREHFKLYGVRR